MIFAFDQSLLQTTGWCLGYILFLTMEGAGLVTLGELSSHFSDAILVGVGETFISVL